MKRYKLTKRGRAHLRSLFEFLAFTGVFAVLGILNTLIMNMS